MAPTLHTRRLEGSLGLDPTLYVLEDGNGGVAEVWPALGFNCIRWTALRAGQPLDLLYQDPALFHNGRPTRSGIPVLFPFPNRIREGRFSFDGRSYQLPLNDSTMKNAIHGFACRVPWRVVDQGADQASAWVTGEFRCARDARDCLPLWPADAQIRLTVRLGKNTLRLEAEVSNPDTKPLPWGLGYHPYFRLPFTSAGSSENCTVEVPAQAYWELRDNLPTGQKLSVDSSRDLQTPRRFAELQLDDVLTALPARPARVDGLIERATLHDPAAGEPLRLFCSREFGQLVVFTPPHRQAFCVEPYTCTTDAINLKLPAAATGWSVLAPGRSVQLVVEMWL